MARNADPLRTGKSKQHRERKNGAAREAWQKRKARINEARGPQNITEEMPETDMGATRFIRSRA